MGRGKYLLLRMFLVAMTATDESEREDGMMLL